MGAREFDLVLHGASGFVGQLLAARVALVAPPGLRVALSGRSRQKLEQVRAGLPGPGRGWPVRVADSDDRPALDALAAATTVLVSTVGPYARHGLPVVAACAEAGTHYADLTGEVLFVREAIDRTDAVARSTGARIVHACGYDSIPSDLAVLLLARRAAADGTGPLRFVRLAAAARGGFSGGTLASMRHQLATVTADRTARRLAADPYALSPDRAAEPDVAQPADLAPPRRDRHGRWSTAFVMASFNTRVVRRSNALADYAYGTGMRYGEVMDCGRGATGAATAYAVPAVLGGLLLGARHELAGAALDRLLPAAGTGPDPATQARGWFRMRVTAVTADGAHYRAEVAGPGDPGYRATSVMLAETALALAGAPGPPLPDVAGSLTPATALGEALVTRLRAAGHTYEVHREPGRQ